MMMRLNEKDTFLSKYLSNTLEPIFQNFSNEGGLHHAGMWKYAEKCDDAEKDKKYTEICEQHNSDFPCFMLADAPDTHAEK